MRYIDNPPDAASLMMSARSLGNYDLPSAIADLIDNSIKAKARRVSLTCLLQDDGPEVRILDDGEGMAASVLQNAMRPASTNPTAKRSPDDLGRFGWGMKSASFSQCRRLFVLSHADGQLSGAEWDLDNVDSWRMGVLDRDDVITLADPELLKRSGTEIIWRECDRLSENGRILGDAFNELVSHARRRLALVFHRYLSGEAGTRRLSISMNGLVIEPFDPFHRENNATQPLPPETIQFPDGNSLVIRGFILPHFSKLAMADYDRLGGEEGFVRNQGFYVYRNNRLIINGTWFRLVRHGELSQLIRIAIDIPNSLDEMWKITVDKADAQLPSVLRERLRSIVNNLKKGSSEIFRSRGARISTRGATPVWSKYARGGQIRYYINREHPLMVGLLEASDPAQAKAAIAAITLIEQNFPAATIGEDVNRAPDEINQSDFDARSFLEMLDAALPLLLHQAGDDMKKLRELLKVTEPYTSHMRIIEDHLNRKGWS